MLYKNPQSHVLVHVPCFESVKSGLKFQFVHGYPSVVAGVLHTWKDAGPLKVKYLVNAGNFERNFQSNPLRF